ncbi:kelch motif protein (macronuclear) [Tetrahymena thermophila SB210]|uniref:Kelch motif protein n=1 Tax=Tetrahymena thermophila (strain SB210) TaxID=312017 RepID=I7M666_TETTS|nr:kelch motif protein [Tetrahymena thermophila SB210]EAR84446.2 kelch motif protein [Tetrahymena thermophila SB210]|eukprot:XP_001032109.2 kelch motif protein [Tetrahymena thermophila SB210]
MAEELKEEVQFDRTKGFVCLSQPYIKVKDSQDEDVKQFLVEQNYQQFMDSINESQLNSKGVPYYNFTFYEIQDYESPCSFFPEDIKSSDENEVQPLDWNLYSSCCRISQSRYILTGGVKMNLDYIQVFQQKNVLSKQCKQKVKEYQEYIKLLQSKQEGESEQGQRIRMLKAVEKASTIKQSEVAWEDEGEFENQKKLFAQILQNEIHKLKLKCEKEMVKLDKKYCEENNIEYRQKEDLPEDALIFNQYSPYSSEVIEVVFKFNPEEEQYEFTAKYLDNMPKCLSNHASIFHKGKVYVFGGVCQQVLLNTVYAYDIISDTWSEMPKMNLPRINLSAASLGDFIYVIGGNTTNFNDEQNGFEYTTLERLNTAAENPVWEKLTFKRKLKPSFNYLVNHQLKLLSYKNQLLLIGGTSLKQDSDEAKQSVQVFQIEIAGEKWQINALESSLQVRNGEVISKSTYKGKECFYVYGGVPQLKLECFELEVNDKEVVFEKILDCDYTNEINEYFDDHVVCQPKLFLD